MTSAATGPSLESPSENRAARTFKVTRSYSALAPAYSVSASFFSFSADSINAIAWAIRTLSVSPTIFSIRWAFDHEGCVGRFGVTTCAAQPGRLR